MATKEHQNTAPVIPELIHQLAVDIDQFTNDYDTYEYWDDVEDTEENISQIENDIFEGKAEGIKEFLGGVNAEDDLPDEVEKAKSLLRRLNSVETNNVPSR